MSEKSVLEQPVDSQAKNATLLALLDRAEKALEPFAEAHKAYDSYSICVRVDEFRAPTMRRLQAPTDNEVSIILGGYPVSETEGKAVFVRVSDFRLARSTLEDIRKGKG